MSFLRILRTLPVNSHAAVAGRVPPEPHLSETQRKEVFLALVDAQDQRMSVLQSRNVIAKRFRVSDRLVRRIEQEGLDNEWPPL
jgi:hypothetical protein